LPGLDLPVAAGSSADRQGIRQIAGNESATRWLRHEPALHRQFVKSGVDRVAMELEAPGKSACSGERVSWFQSATLDFTDNGCGEVKEERLFAVSGQLDRNIVTRRLQPAYPFSQNRHSKVGRTQAIAYPGCSDNPLR
jgi:hypothetical protein